MDATITLTLTLNEVNGILAGLSELPAKMSYDLINNIKVQAQGQLQAAAATQQPEVINEGTAGAPAVTETPAV